MPVSYDRPMDNYIGPLQKNDEAQVKAIKALEKRVRELEVELRDLKAHVKNQASTLAQVRRR